MIPENISRFDGMLSILAAVGLWPAMIRLWRAECLAPFEDRLKWILVSLFLMLVGRVPYLGFDVEFFGAITYVMALILGFTVFLYFETLLRRHMPTWLKLTSSFGTALLVVDAGLGQMHGHRDHLIVFGGFLFFHMLAISLVVMFRRRSDYTSIENNLLGLSVFSLWSFGLFLLSDITTYGLEGLPRLGAVGVLLFAYISMYNQSLFERRLVIVRKIFKALIFSGLLLFATERLLPHLSNQEYIRLYLLFVVINLIFRIWFAVKHLDGTEEFYGFVRAVSEGDKSSLKSFMCNLGDYFGNIEQKVFRLFDQKEYDGAGLVQLFDARNTQFFVLFEIQEILKEERDLPERHRYWLEQIVDMLEKNEMTYISLLGRRDPYVLLFSVPIVGYRAMIDLKTRLLSEVAELTENHSAL